MGRRTVRKIDGPTGREEEATSIAPGNKIAATKE